MDVEVAEGSPDSTLVDVEPMLGKCSVTLLHNTTLAEGILFEGGASKA